MNILDTIVAEKAIEVAERKKHTSIAALEQMHFFKTPVLSLTKFVLDPTKTGIIAEYKRKSPSKGIINDQATVPAVTEAYAKYGASGISVLTDEPFFGGHLQDLVEATTNAVPLLRKDFIIDEYQIIEAKAHGASVILLIAACLSKEKVKSLAAVAKNLGLEVLLEIHNKEELEHVCNDVDLVGVNNRNLKTFQVSIETSLQLIEQMPKDKPAVAESGISEISTIHTLQQAGFKAFLIGENFMKAQNPAQAFQDFVTQLKQKHTS